MQKNGGHNKHTWLLRLGEDAVLRPVLSSGETAVGLSGARGMPPQRSPSKIGAQSTPRLVHGMEEHPHHPCRHATQGIVSILFSVYSMCKASILEGG